MKRLIAALLSSMVIASCTFTNESFDSLANKGILPLSTTNAYVGANLFLADEFSRSTHLFNFLKERGAPAALEVEQTKFGPPHLLLYYPHERQIYMADLALSDEMYQWIVRGPFQIEHKDYRELAKNLRSEIGEPAFVYQGRIFRFRPTPEELAKLYPTPTPQPTPTPKKVIKKPKVIKNVEDAQADATPKPGPDRPFQPMNSDQQAISMAQGFAERASNGDVIHTVKSDEDTLEKIATWYTGSPTNAKEIAEANGLAAGTAPKVGARIQIPLKMVKQFKALK